MTQHRVRNDLKLLLPVFSDVQSRIQFPERTHRFLSEMEKLVDLSTSSAIRDRVEKLRECGVFSRFGHFPPDVAL